MKLGMNLLLWSDDVRDERFGSLFPYLRSVGFDGVEVPIMEPDPAGYRALAARLDAAGLACTAVTVLRPEHDPRSADPAVRARTIEHLTGLLESAAALGAPLLVGPLYAPLGVLSGRGPTEADWGFAIDSLRAVAERADERRVTLAVEPLNRFEIDLLNTAEAGARFVRAVGHPRCRLLYDTFHAHIEEQHVGRAVASAAAVLAHVHVSENDRGTPGRGQVDWGATFAALGAAGYDGWLTVEAFGTALPHLAAATRIWRRTFENERALAAEAAAFLRGARATVSSGCRQQLEDGAPERQARGSGSMPASRHESS